MELWQAREEALAKSELLDRQVQVKEGHVVLNPTPDNSLTEYNIALHRCDTPAKLLGWIQHLTEKTWLTTDMIDRFISVACHQNKIEIEHDA